MKSRDLKIAAIVAGVSLPLSIYAGGDKSDAGMKDKHASTTASSDHLEETHMGADRYITEDSEPGFRSDRDTDDSFAMSEESEASSEWRSEPDESRMQLTSTSIKKVEERELRNKLMADELVGKTVVDRDGQEIGEVRSIALTSLDKQEQQQSSSDSFPSSSQQGNQAEVHVYIDAQDGDSILEVPLSELTLDDQQEDLRLDVAQSDLDSLSIRAGSLATTD